MDQESVVYGCIKDVLSHRDSEEIIQHREKNRAAMQSLPSVEDWPLLSREMFSMPVQTTDIDEVQTDVMHFGTSYKGVEYEWQAWLKKFEDMLSDMYWVSATVHLETELNGIHTFTWEPSETFHEPGSGKLEVRCEWSRETSGF